MRELQIFILDLAGNQLGELELTDSDDFALKLTKSIASINDLGRRNTSFSLDFEAPQTKNNNRLLAGLRFASHTKEVLGKKPCAIMVDGNQVDRGFLYAFSSDTEGQYKLNFKGLNNDWVERLRDVELNQLNWRDHITGLRTEEATESFTGLRIDELNAQNSENFDLIYPYINRNNSSDVQSFRPQLHLRSIIISMFEKIGYTIDSDFIESDWIKGGAAVTYEDLYSHSYTHLGLSIDPAFQMKREEDELLSYALTQKVEALPPTATPPSSWTGQNYGLLNIGATPAAPSLRNIYRFPTLINDIIKDDSNRFAELTSEYTVGISGVYNLSFNFNFEFAYYDTNTLDWELFNINQQQLLITAPSFSWVVVKNNTSDIAIDGTPIYTTLPQAQTYDSLNVNSLNLVAGDKISVFIAFKDDALDDSGQPYSWNNWRARINNDSQLDITLKANLELGDIFRINSHIPKGIKCLTLLQDFKTMFNLYFEADPDRRVVTIEPRDDFFKNELVDITEKIDFNKSPTLNYLTDYKNEMVFKYKTDSNDKYLEQWNKTNDRDYGKYTYSLKNNERFEKGQSTLTTTLISATIQGELDRGGIMTSVIKEGALAKDNEGKPVNDNYGMRIFQLVRGRQYDSANNERRTESPLIVTVGIMENFDNTPTFNYPDQEQKKLTFVGENGLVWDYYRKTLANIEDTAVLGISLNLTLYDFISWDLRKVYFISEPAEIAGHYITDSIKNFNVTKEGLTPITLVKFKDYRPSEVQGGSGNVDIITDNIPEPEPILCTVNGAIVNCLDNDLQIMFKI